jgi:DNA-binding IclR family transcriptional regulator
VPALSVDKALAILKEFSASEPLLGVSELGRRLGMTKSTVHRLVGSLVKSGLAKQDPGSRQYTLAWESAQLGYTAIYSVPLLRIAFPYLHYLAHQAQETVYMAMRKGDEAYPVLQVLSPTLREQLDWYRRFPLHSTSTGKVLLAYGEESVLRKLLAKGLPAPTAHTITDPVELRQELDKVREQGFAACFEEDEPGVNGIAVPVRDPDGSVVAALAVAGPAYSLTHDKAYAAVEQLKAISGEITQKLREAR